MLTALIAKRRVWLAAGSAVGVVVLLAAAFGGAWKIQSWRYESRLAALHSSYAQTLAAAQATARAIEQQRQQDLERVSDETERRLTAVVVAERRAADKRVRDVAARYAERERRAARDTGAADQCAANTARARVLADLLGELDELAQGYAREADHARVAGLACEAAFDAVRLQGGKKQGGGK